MTAPALAIRDLGVDFHAGGKTTSATRSVDIEVDAGEILAIVGESGSGKSISALSVLDLLPSNATRSGRIELGGRDVTALTGGELQQLRGRDVAMVFQEPMTALNPVFTVGAQIVEALRLHLPMSRRQARERAVELLSTVGMPEPERRFGSYPHQLSGGQRQRAMIAMAISCEPKVLIADEPTTALDVTVQAEILDLLRELRHRLDSAIVIITHDMGVVADIADRVVVMRDGEIVEEAPVDDLFRNPSDPYTRDLLAAVPHLGRRHDDHDTEVSGTKTDTALDLIDVVLEYPGGLGRPTFRAVDGVSLSIPRGQVLGLVGESGSGKSTIGRCAVGLLHAAAGQVFIDGHDVTRASRHEWRSVRSRVGMVFQDPASSLNPRFTIGDCIAEPMRLHGERADRRSLEPRVTRLLEAVQLPADWRHRFPHELSGGQRQRVGIARAVALEPVLLVADEPTSALDVSVQAHVLDLLRGLQSELGFSCLFISHDLAVVELLADSIAVMRDGQLVEQGSRSEVLTRPSAEYTRRLLAAAPVPDPIEQRRLRQQRVGDVDR